jgi:signal transduction histidine kinase
MPHGSTGAANPSKPQQPAEAHVSSQLEEADRYREDQIAMVYHDLRSPLSNILFSLEVLSTLPAFAQDATAQSMVEIAQRSTERIQRLVDSLLDIQRLEAGQAIAKQTPASMRKLVGQAFEAVLPMANTKKLKISASLADPLPPALVDGEMILRVLINLLENALRFTPEEGTIQVTVQPQGDLLLTSIQDSGPGIAPEDQERIFEKFTHLVVANEPRGAGLGLAFCRLAVSAHGGQIWVESSPGRGSTFFFTLPAAQQP